LDNFNDLNLKKLIVTFYKKDQKVYKTEVFNSINYKKIQQTELIANGDFRNSEMVEILKEADIDLVTMDSDLDHGYLQFSQLMDLIVAKSTDYRALELIPVNRPVPQDKLQNTPIQRHRSTQPRSPVV
jgi:hypothetical protein